ncbi:MAG: hypothetical protein R3D53_14125 [Paracoccaceae bacterium]
MSFRMCHAWLISMIETNRSSPSVASLRKILGGLNVTMSEFFGPTAPPTRPCSSSRATCAT